MLDLEELFESVFGGVGAGSIAYAGLTYVSATTGQTYYGILADSLFGLLTLLGILSGITRARKKDKTTPH